MSFVKRPKSASLWLSSSLAEHFFSRWQLGHRHRRRSCQRLPQRLRSCPSHSHELRTLLRLCCSCSLGVHLFLRRLDVIDGLLNTGNSHFLRELSFFVLGQQRAHQELGYLFRIEVKNRIAIPM